MGGYNNLGLSIENSDTTEVIQENKKAVVEAYNLSGMLKEEISIFSLRRIKMQENLTKLYGLVWGQCYHNIKAEIYGVDEFSKKSRLKTRCVCFPM